MHVSQSILSPLPPKGDSPLTCGRSCGASERSSRRQWLAHMRDGLLTIVLPGATIGEWSQPCTTVFHQSEVAFAGGELDSAERILPFLRASTD